MDLENRNSVLEIADVVVEIELATVEIVEVVGWIVFAVKYDTNHRKDSRRMDQESMDWQNDSKLEDSLRKIPVRLSLCSIHLYTTTMVTMI